MTTEENEDSTIYRVVVNHEEQYSIWPDARKKSCRLEGRGQSGRESGMSSLYQGSVDGYATAEFKDGNGRGQGLAVTKIRISSVCGVVSFDHWSLLS